MYSFNVQSVLTVWRPPVAIALPWVSHAVVSLVTSVGPILSQRRRNDHDLRLKGPESSFSHPHHLKLATTIYHLNSTYGQCCCGAWRPNSMEADAILSRGGSWWHMAAVVRCQKLHHPEVVPVAHQDPLRYLRALLTHVLPAFLNLLPEVASRPLAAS